MGVANVMAATGSVRRARGHLGLVVTLIALISALAAPGVANAGELTYRGCVTENRELGPSGSGACVRIRHSGLNGPTSVALSHDGKSLYTAGYARVGASWSSSAVARFDRDPATGALTYRGCITGDSRLGGSGGCDVVPGLSEVRSVTVSPEGNSVYAAGGPIVARFDRDPTTGALTYRGCISGSKQFGPSGDGACDTTPSATTYGGGTGMGWVNSVAVSPDGGSLYITAPDLGPDGPSGDAAVARFDREPTTGALTYRDCISGNTALGPAGTGACVLIPSARSGSLDSGLSPWSLWVSPDGESVYTGSKRGAATGGDRYGSSGVARFDRDPTTGALTYRGCITGDRRSGPSGSGACAAIPSATKDGVHSGLMGSPLAGSPDGKSLYVGGESEIARLDRDPTTGALTYRDCITGDKRSGPSGSGACTAIPSATWDGDGSGLVAPTLTNMEIAMSPDGRTLYAGGASSVARLDRDPATGALEFRDCVTGDTFSGPSGSGACTAIRSATERADGSGLGVEVDALAASQDGASLYAATCCHSDDSLVARFGFAPQTRISGARTHGHRAVFRFRAGKRSKFECKLKGRHVKPKLRDWRSCGSDRFRRRGRQVYRGLRSGRKVFRVRASDDVGNTDPITAKRRWRVR